MNAEPLAERDQYEFGFDPHFFDRTLDGMTVPLVVVDGLGQVRYANFAAVDLAGWDLEEGLGKNMLEFVHPDDHDLVVETFLALVNMDEGETILGSNMWGAIRFRVMTKGGVIIPVEAAGKVALKDGAINGIVLTLQDIRIETVGKRILQGIAERDDIEAMMTDLTEGITLPPADLAAAVYRSRGRHHLELIHTTDPALGAIPLDDDRVGSVVPAVGPVTRLATIDLPVVGEELLEAGYEEFLHVGVTSPDELVSYRFVAAQSTYLPAARGGLLRMEWARELANLLLIYDRANRLLKQEATIDPLTGLRNRRGLSEYLDAVPSDQSCLVFFIDLDDFKLVNDEHGHQVGDRVLGVVADRIRRAVRLDDVVGRLGGDEFAILVTDDDLSSGTAEVVATRVVTSMSEPISANGIVVDLSASVGVAEIQPPLDSEGVFDSADKAMYRAKRSGGGRFAVATPETTD